MITDNSGQLCLVYLHDHIAQRVRTAVRMRVVDSNGDNLSLPFMSDVSGHCYALSDWCTLFLLWNKHHVTITYIIVVLCLLLALCLSLCLLLPPFRHSSLLFSHSLTLSLSFSPLFLSLSPSPLSLLLQSSTQYAQETGVQSKESRKYIFRSLLDMNHVPPPSASMDNREAILTSVDRMEFISLLSRMLTLDPTQRIRPLAALQTPFITMQHLAMHTNTQTVWEWIQAMSVCHQPRLSTTPIATPLATPIVTPLAGLQHNPLQLLSHPNGGIPSAAACCRQIQQAPPTLSSTTALYPTAVIPHNGTHLVSHTPPTKIGPFIVIFLDMSRGSVYIWLPSDWPHPPYRRERWGREATEGGTATVAATAGSQSLGPTRY